MRATALSVGLAAVLLLAACSGDDDDSDAETETGSTEVSSEVSSDVSTVEAEPSDTTSGSGATTTVAPEPDELVTEGATVVVANSSTVGGAAGRMTEQLSSAGFTTRQAMNGTDRLRVSVVYFTPAEGAEAVAESVAAVLGGVDVEPVPDAIPTASGRMRGAQVLVMLGTAQADRTLDELEQGGTVDTAGAVVVVANAAGVDGAAGAMSAELEFAGFEVGTPTNGTGERARSIVFYGDAAGAQDDAELVAELLGGVNVRPLPEEIPTESGELDGDVLVLLGARQAGTSIELPGQ